MSRHPATPWPRERDHATPPSTPPMRLNRSSPFGPSRRTSAALSIVALGVAAAFAAPPPGKQPEPKPAANTAATKPAATKPPGTKPPTAKPPAPKATPTPTVPAEPKAVFECRWTTEPVAIDGRADDDAWRDAPTIDGFRANWA